MMIPDLVNGLFEVVGGCFLLMNVWSMIQHKELKGVHWGPTVFFTSWGAWNLFYYPHLDQWFSFAGGLFIFLVNIVWLSLTFYYLRNNKKDECRRS